MESHGMQGQSRGQEAPYLPETLNAELKHLMPVKLLMISAKPVLV